MECWQFGLLLVKVTFMNPATQATDRNIIDYINQTILDPSEYIRGNKTM